MHNLIQLNRGGLDLLLKLKVYGLSENGFSNLFVGINVRYIFMVDMLLRPY